MKLEAFKLLSKSEQKLELTRVSKKYRKRYSTTGNKTNNATTYERCIQENQGLESEEVSSSPQNSFEQPLTQLGKTEGEPILSTTLRCLELLEYPHRYVEQRENDIESYMAPFQVLAKNLSRSLEGIVATDNAAQTFISLLVDIRTHVCVSHIPEIAKDLFRSFGVESESNTIKPTPTGWEATVQKNTEIIQDALLFALAMFRTTLPAVPPHKAQWPQDFSMSERKELQRFIRTEMHKTEDAFSDSISQEAVNVLFEELRSKAALPFEKANVRVIRRVVVQLRAEKRGQAQKINRRKKRKSDEMEEGDEEEEEAHQDENEG